MYTNAQNQLILRVLNKALDLSSFVTNQYLISKLVFQEQCYKLPIKVFMAYPEFITMQVTEEDIADSAKSLHGYYTIDNYIYIPYQIYPFMLVIKDFCMFGDPLEITSYIKALHGNKHIAIHKMANDIVVTFQNIEDCVVFWRGTKYYPFKGEKFIESQIYSLLHVNFPLIPIQDVINAPQNNQTHQTYQTESREQQFQRQGHQRSNDQYNEKFQQSSQNYQQKKSSRPQYYRYNSKSDQYNGDGNSQRFSQSTRLNKNKDRYYSQNQQHKPQPHILLQASPKQQPNPPTQYRSQPQIQPRSHSQPLVLQQNQQKLQMQSKFQQQPQTPQSPQSPQSHNRNYRQNQQQQQNHYQQEQQQNQEQPQQQNHHQQEQQQQQEQPQPSSARSPKPKKYYRPNPKKQNQKK